jgi:hypothetical protein
MISPCWLFENLDRSREFLRLRLLLGWQERDRWYKVVEICGTRPSRQDFPKDHYKERKANLRSSIVSSTDNDFMRKLQNRLAHTFTYSANLGFWQLIVWKCNTFQSWCNAYACAVRCSWCTLEWLVTHMRYWLQGQSKVGRGSVWRVAISQPRYLARS